MKVVVIPAYVGMTDKMDKDRKLSAETYNKKIDEHMARFKVAYPDALSVDDSADD